MAPVMLTNSFTAKEYHEATEKRSDSINKGQFTQMFRWITTNIAY